MPSVEPVVVVPLREFRGMTRLEPLMSPVERLRLARLLAERLVGAASTAGLRVAVVTTDDEVGKWATSGAIDVVIDPGEGLSAAAAAGVQAGDGRPWIVAHADLPFVTPAALIHVANLATHSIVLVPSLDGGTNVIAGTGSFPFSYGPGSFHRHLASAPGATIVHHADLSVDVDTPQQFRAVARLSPSLIAG